MRGLERKINRTVKELKRKSPLQLPEISKHEESVRDYCMEMLRIEVSRKLGVDISDASEIWFHEGYNQAFDRNYSSKRNGPEVYLLVKQDLNRNPNSTQKS